MEIINAVVFNNGKDGFDMSDFTVIVNCISSTNWAIWLGDWIAYYFGML